MNIKLSEIPTFGGIYKFINTINNKIYIGSSKNLRKRFIQHLSNLKSNSHHSIHFQNAWNKYGEESFEYQILEIVDNQNELLIREQYYLDTLLFSKEYINKENSKFIELGYNINPIASNRLGSKQPENSIKKSILHNPKVLPILQFDFNGNFIKEYISSGEASNFTGIDKCSILNCCKHNIEYTHSNFFIFKKELNQYKTYFESLKEAPFIPHAWNKGISIRINKKDCLILFDRYGRFIKTFAFQTDVCKFIKCTSSNLSNAKNKKIIKNYLLFDLNFNYIPIIKEIRNKYDFIENLNLIPNKIMVYDNFDNFIGGFESVEDAAEIMNMKSNSIYGVLSGKRKQNEGFKFKYYDDIV